VSTLKIKIPSKNMREKPTNIQDASVNRAILQHCFVWFGKTGEDPAIAVLLPTLKYFSCNGAVDWSTKCFCCERVSQNR
jgi:hypothetical protein